jgi:hypothetical protein
MPKFFLKTAVQVGFSLTLLAAAGALYKGSSLWACGVLTAAYWMFLNVYFLFRLLDPALSAAAGAAPKAQERRAGNLLVLSVLKFPVIYLTGYFILKTRFFPIGSILTGLTLFIIGMIVAWLRTQNSEGRSSELGARSKNLGAGK